MSSTDRPIASNHDQLQVDMVVGYGFFKITRW